MKKLGTSQIVLALVLFTGGLTIVGNGCSRFISEPAQSNNPDNNQQEVLPETGGGSGDIPVIPGTKTMSIFYAAQALDHFAVCSGLRKPSDRTIATFDIKKGSMTSNGQVNTITAGGLMAVVALVGDVCDDLIVQDIASPRLFVNFNMAGTTLPSDSDLSNAAARLAISCWSRKPDTQEAAYLLNMIKASVSNETNASRKSALLLCTTVLSSLDAVVN